MAPLGDAGRALPLRQESERSAMLAVAEPCHVQHAVMVSPRVCQKRDDTRIMVFQLPPPK